MGKYRTIRGLCRNFSRVWCTGAQHRVSFLDPEARHSTIIQARYTLRTQGCIAAKCAASMAFLNAIEHGDIQMGFAIHGKFELSVRNTEYLVRRVYADHSGRRK